MTPKKRSRAYRLARGEQVKVDNPAPRVFVDWSTRPPVAADKIFEGCVPIPGEQQAPEC